MKTTLKYTEEGVSFDLDVNIDVIVTEGSSDKMLLIIPGIDGSVSGYKNKYDKIAQDINKKYGATVIQMSNPANPAGDHTRNFFVVMRYIENHFDMTKKQLHIAAHSLGAFMASVAASEYEFVGKILLINPATRLNINQITLDERPKESNIFLIGSEDLSFYCRERFEKLGIVKIEPGADHHFTGKYFKKFIEAPAKYLFEK